MRKSTRALIGLVVIDVLLGFGTLWLVMQVKDGAATAVPPEKAIETITTIGGAAIGVATALLGLAWLYWRRRDS